MTKMHHYFDPQNPPHNNEGNGRTNLLCELPSIDYRYRPRDGGAYPHHWTRHHSDVTCDTCIFLLLKKKSDG